MVHTPSQAQSNELSSVEAELQNTVAGAPVSPIEQLAQAASVEQIAHRVKTGARIAVLSSMVLMSNPSLAEKSPYEPLADASGKTQLVLKEDAKGKEELFKLFDQEDIVLFNSLPSEDQKKVLSYYNEGKDKKTNAKKFYKGTVNLMRYYRDLKIVDAILEQMKKTGKLPDGEIPSIGISAQIATNGFVGGSVYVKLEKANEFDAMIIDKLGKEAAGLKQEAAGLKQEAAGLKQEAAGLKQEAEKIRKNIDVLRGLLKAL